MRIKTVLAAAALALAPGLAAAGCFGSHKAETASSCPAGQVWDAGSQACTTPASS